jgi:hypothetical protein
MGCDKMQKFIYKLCFFSYSYFYEFFLTIFMHTQSSQIVEKFELFSFGLKGIKRTKK